MRRFLMSAVAVLVLNAHGAERDTKNSFQNRNPDYRTRAGAFYEKKYLPGAMKGLIAAFAPQELSETQARRMLLELIYDFLDQYSTGGAVTRRKHAQVLAKLDSSVKELADGPTILENYEEWKSGGSKTFPNPLAFLTRIAAQSPPVKLTLNEEFERQGWRVRSLESLEQTGDYADMLGIEPYQVFILQHEGVPGRNDNFTLLVYRLRDSGKLLEAMKAYNGKRPAAPMRLFWRTGKHVVFVPAYVTQTSTVELEEWIKAQWMGN